MFFLEKQINTEKKKGICYGRKKQVSKKFQNHLSGLRDQDNHL